VSLEAAFVAGASECDIWAAAAGITPADKPTNATLSFKNRRRADNLELMGAPLPLEVAKSHFLGGQYTSGRITSEKDTAAQAFDSEHSSAGHGESIPRIKMPAKEWELFCRCGAI
jgi:hypothetical protein